MEKLKLVYDKPVPYEEAGPDTEEIWNEALPIGSGSMGAMVFGGVCKEKLQLNEDTIWYGSGGRNRVNKNARDHYLEVRKLLQRGEILKAQNLAKDTLMPVPDQQRNYSTAGDVWLTFHEEEAFHHYKRCLNLNEAVVTVEYSLKDRSYQREYFASAVHQVIAIHQEAGEGKTLNGCISLSNFRKNVEAITVHPGGLLSLTGVEGGGGCKYCIMAAIKKEGGTVEIYRDQIRIKDADSFTVYLTIRSDFYQENPVSWCMKTLNTVLQIPYEQVKQAHILEYKSYFGRVEFTLKTTEDKEHLPVPIRLEKIKRGEKDLGLIAAYFQFGRYLLISSSRPGSQPANLQGIWNRLEHPAWGSKYTININTEMNYWPAETCNLSECHMPLFDLIRRMLPNGEKVAKDMYGLSGFVAHHNTDLFGDCAPQDSVMSSTIWPLGAAWLCLHIWNHYEYTQDVTFLMERLDLIKQASRFFTEYLFENQNGELVTGPSISPENTYIHSNGQSGQLCIGPSMDTEIIKDLFTACLKAAKITDCEDELTQRIETLLPCLPSLSVGKHGQLMEWAKDYEEAEPGHRHISHLYALYPSEQITFEKTPELMKAARVTLEKRLANGGGHTGWSRAWIIHMWARLRDGEKAGENVEALLTQSTYPNLFDRHPPFQIDGNFGGTSGIAEMLLQCMDHTLYFLPALPKDWSEGSITGLKAKGAITVSLSWKSGQLKQGRLVVERGGRVAFRKPDSIVNIETAPEVHKEQEGLLVVCNCMKPYEVQLTS